MALTNDARSFIIIVSILSAVSTLFGVSRLVIRRRGLLGADDYVLAFALVMVWAQAAGAFILNILGGVGKPFLTLTPDEMTWLFKMFFWPELGYTLLVASVKMSILLSYKRLFGHHKSTRLHIYIMMGLVMAWGIAIFFTCVFQCWPIDKAWEPLKPGTCIDLVAFLWGNSVSNFIIDWLILLVPAIPVWKLHMDRSQKFLVAGSFALGSLACIASTVRAATTGSVDVNDLSKSVFMASVWTYIEPNLAIISACLPFVGRSAGKVVMDAFDYAYDLGSIASSRLHLRSRNSAFSASQSRTQGSRTVTQRTDIRVDSAERKADDHYELQSCRAYAASHHSQSKSTNSTRSLV